MKRKYLLLSVALVALFALMNTTRVSSNKAFPLPGEVGDPTNPNGCNTSCTCAQSGCHPQPALASNSSILTMVIDTQASFATEVPLNSSFHFIPGKDYYVGFLVNSNSGVYGFQLTAIAPGNTMAGALAVTNSSTTRLTSAGNISYIGHKNASANNNWPFKWTAPSSATDPATLYFCYNTSDTASLSANIPGGDIYAGTLALYPVGVSAINGVQDVYSNLNIYPNPVTNDFGMSFVLKQSETVTAGIYSIDGKMAKELMNERLNAGEVSRSFDLSTFPAGVYLVKLSAGETTVTRKIVKED
ncbi:MAG TPA: T9SS type A sorting domain-containing protein [Chitinophagales bacterium]|nr:T9SS type A sorting domain-containing protein [Chitinophagales bacterium]